jgi:hypothetical protein
LDENAFDLLQKSPPEGRDRVVIRMFIHRNEPESNRVMRRLFEFSARKHACRIAVNQNGKQK